MEVSCDPEKAYSEGCCELSSVVSHPSNITAFLFLVIGVEYVWSHMVTYLYVHCSVEDMQRSASRGEDPLANVCMGSLASRALQDQR